MSFGMHGGGMGGGVPNPNNDFQVANPPSDGVSSLSWSSGRRTTGTNILGLAAECYAQVGRAVRKDVATLLSNLA